MKRLTLFIGAGLICSALTFAGIYSNKATEKMTKDTPSKFSMLPEWQKAEIIQGINSDCTFDGIALKGKVQIVESFPDIKVQWVESFPDIKVKWVSSFPDDCGEWQEVTSFPDFKIQIVTSFPDVKAQEVTSFPGL